jgi:hypothetical protein
VIPKEAQLEADEAFDEESDLLRGNAEYLHRISSPDVTLRHGGKGACFGGKRR